MYHQFDHEELNGVLTQTLANTVEAMAFEGLISFEAASKFVEDHFVILTQPKGFLRTKLDRLFGRAPEDKPSRLVVARIVNRRPGT